MTSLKSAIQGTLAVVVALTSTSFLARAASQDDLSSTVSRALAAAPANFQAFRANAAHGDGFQTFYETTAALRRFCPSCTVADEYADADYDERWALSFKRTVPKNWSDAQVIAYLRTTLSPLMSGYLLTYEEKPNYTDFGWWRKASHTFLYARTFRDKSGRGFEVRVGHYLPNNVHIVRFSRGFTEADKAELTAALTSFVRLGTSDASNNFTSMRGDALDKTYFHLSHSFGDTLSGCSISGVLGAETPKWVMSCETPHITMGNDEIKELIRSDIVAALPAGFTETTDPKYLGPFSEYRWDRSSDLVSIDVSDFGALGSTSYTIEIYHYLK